MQPLQTNSLVRLVKIMNDMHDCATSGDWQELARLDVQRRVILEFSSADVEDTKTDVAGKMQYARYLNPSHIEGKSHSANDSKRDFLIGEIRSLDKRILDVVQTGRQRLLDENRGLSAQTKAKELYARTSSIT